MPACVPAPGAALGRGDPTRRWAIDTGHGESFPGLTRGEADAALAAVPSPVPSHPLLVVTLDVIVSDGAGPYLLTPDGVLVLALGDHPDVVGVRVAMGDTDGDRIVGIVESVAGPWWRWRARSRIAAEHSVTALDALVAAPPTAWTVPPGIGDMGAPSPPGA